MALNHSPKIVTDGLVFAYDMANTKKSWKGMPTTNQFTLPTADVNGFGVQNGTFTRIRTGNYGGYEITPTDYVWRYNVTGNECPYHGWDIPTTAGAVVTFSFDYYVDPSTTNYPVTNYLANFENAGSGVGGSIGDPTPSIKGVWKRAYFSSTATATGNSRCLLYPGACGGRLGDAGFILYKNPQVEFNAPGSIPSPFVSGTRYANNNLEPTPSYPAWNQSASSASGGTLTFANGSYNSKGTWDLYKTYSGLSTGTNYTWSALVKLGTATNFLVTMNNTQSWNTGPSAQFSGELSTSEYRRVYITGTTNTGSFNLHIGASYNTELASTVQTGGTIFIRDVRLELTGSQTALVDLTGNNTITANSLTYASDNTFSFNGTNGYVSCGNLGLFYPQGTISFWMNSTSVTSYRNPFHTNYTGSGNNTGIRFEQVTSGLFGVVVGNDAGTYAGYTLTSSLSANTWYYVTVTWSTSTNTLTGYINGVQSFSSNHTYWATQLASVCFGVGFSSDRFFSGLISNASIYNRALSAAEVKQNFNALRGRYGL